MLRDRLTIKFVSALALLIGLSLDGPAFAGGFVATHLPDTLSQGGLVIVRLSPGSQLVVAENERETRAVAVGRLEVRGQLAVGEIHEGGRVGEPMVSALITLAAVAPARHAFFVGLEAEDPIG